jgi:hypothetical protein
VSNEGERQLGHSAHTCTGVGKTGMRIHVYMHAYARVQQGLHCQRAVRVCASTECQHVPMCRRATLPCRFLPSSGSQNTTCRSEKLCSVIVQREHGGLGKRRRSIKNTSTHTFASARTHTNALSLSLQQSDYIYICILYIYI